MKKTILIGIAAAVVIATAFVYVPRATTDSTNSPQVAPQTQTVSITATTSETVIDAMRAFSSVGALTFTGRDYPGMGLFVDSINGQKNADGKYWVFYVNGISATSGVSSVVVKAGDTIEWKYEKSY